MTEHLILQKLDAIEQRQQRLEAVLQVFASRQTDVTHVTLAEAARITGMSKHQVRRSYRLDVIPGTRRTGVALKSLCEGWMDLATARVIAAREKKSA